MKVHPETVPVCRSGLELPAAEASESIASLPSGRHFRLAPAAVELLRRIDGRKDLRAIAAEFPPIEGHRPNAEDLAQVVESILLPRELVYVGEEPAETLRIQTPVWARLPLIPARLVDQLARPLAALFAPAFLRLAVPAVALVFAWFFGGYLFGARPLLPERLLDPALWIPLMLLLEVAGFCHEFGHAAALRRGGERPGTIGLGMYLFFPVFYCDVTRAWRLRRRERVRVDLGGIWFEMLFAALAFVAWGLTGSLVPAAAGMFLIAETWTNLDPFLRMDGYWLVTDLTGIDDLRGYSRRIVGDLFRGRFKARRKLDRIMAAYAVASLLFFAAFTVFAVLVILPRVLEETRAAWQHFRELLAGDSGAGNLFDAGFAVVTGGFTLLGFAIAVLWMLGGGQLLRRLRARKRA
ncbi:MAG TPA: hypothetical protein VGC54_07885 [Planctomycetota bacterium]